MIKKTVVVLICIVFFECSSAWAWFGGKDKTVTPEKVIHISASDEQQIIDVYVGNNQEDYLNFVIKAEYVKNGTELTSKDSSLNDGLDSSAQWDGMSYFSSSKHPTFTKVRISYFNMDERKAVFTVSAKLVAPTDEKYIEFKEMIFELTGDLFDTFAHFISKEKVTITPEQRAQLEEKFGGALYSHVEKLENKFNQFKPDNYQAFVQYKVKDWLPPFNHNKKIMKDFWEKIGAPYMRPEFSEMNKIIMTMTDLNIISITMQSYLRYHKKDDLKFIQQKLPEIYKLAKPYKEFQPKKK
jgi:hypothetical protein